MFNDIIEFIKNLYPNQNPVPLHAPVFLGKEKEYLLDCVDSTYVSYVGKYVEKFEEVTAHFTGAKYAVATVNGTAALQIALQLAGVKYGDEVITQPLTFVATANAISHCGATPIFIDVEAVTLGLSPDKLNDWLIKNAKYDPTQKKTINAITGKNIRAIVPVYTFGHACRIDEIIEIADNFNLPVIEDAAEALGSFYKEKHAGTFGLAGILSYNGNKTVTTGGGGMIITNDEDFAKRARHITTTAKMPHKWEYNHDQTGYNYRLTNIAAALGCAQIETLDQILKVKREVAEDYRRFFEGTEYKFFSEPEHCNSNYWLNTIITPGRHKRDELLDYTNKNAVMTRPVWEPMNRLQMFSHCQTDGLKNTYWLADRILNVPSSAVMNKE